MRSSKKRSRSNQNRPRTLGNIVNRVFDSSGPEGKVRGTPQQIIEKYQMLARDAQLSNDRVAAENFLQHAEHYTRMLAEAMREMAAEQEARQQQYQQGNQNGNQNGGQNSPQFRSDRPDRPDRPERDHRADRADRRPDFARDQRPDYAQDRDPRDLRDPGSAEQPPVVEVIDLFADEPSGLIETPESAPRPTNPAADPVPAGTDAPARRARGPRKPRPEGTPPKEAAE
jgi:hypothetical protein